MLNLEVYSFMSKLYCIGELLIDFQSIGTGTLKETEQFVKKAGGAPANVCVQAVKLGKKAQYLTKVGNDGFGDFLKETLKNEGVDVSHILQSDEYNTSLAFVSIKEDGERDFSFYRTMTADLYFKAEEFEDIEFEKGDVLEFGSVALSTEITQNAHKNLIMKAKKAGALVCFDPNLRFNLWTSRDELRNTVNEFAKFADVIKVGKDELEFLTGKENGMHDIMGDSVSVLLVTDGSKGAKAYVKNGKIFSSSGYKVKAIDATGAGDSFFGAFIAGLMDAGARSENLSSSDMDYQTMLDFACKCGAYTTMGYGAIAAMGTREKVNKAVN